MIYDEGGRYVPKTGVYNVKLCITVYEKMAKIIATTQAGKIVLC